MTAASLIWKCASLTTLRSCDNNSLPDPNHRDTRRRRPHSQHAFHILFRRRQSHKHTFYSCDQKVGQVGKNTLYNSQLCSLYALDRSLSFSLPSLSACVSDDAAQAFHLLSYRRLSSLSLFLSQICDDIKIAICFQQTNTLFCATRYCMQC